MGDGRIPGQLWVRSPNHRFSTTNSKVWREKRTNNTDHYHQGYDLGFKRTGGGLGANVYASFGGKVVVLRRTGRRGFRGYGRVIVIESTAQHDPRLQLFNGGTKPLYAMYAHLGSVRFEGYPGIAAGLELGSIVQPGQLLGTIGTTQFKKTDPTDELGRHAAHLHFEISEIPYTQEDGHLGTRGDKNGDTTIEGARLDPNDILQKLNGFDPIFRVPLGSAATTSSVTTSSSAPSTDPLAGPRSFEVLRFLFSELPAQYRDEVRHQPQGDIKTRIISNVGFDTRVPKVISNIGQKSPPKSIPLLAQETRFVLPRNSPTDAFTGTVGYEAPAKGATSLRPEARVPRIMVYRSFGAVEPIVSTLEVPTEADLIAQSDSEQRNATSNPLVFGRAKQNLITGASATHHIISREGQLINSASWDENAVFGGTLSPSADGIEEAAISIDLEDLIGRVGEEFVGPVERIYRRVPFTEEQYAVMAFILKKYEAWTGNEALREKGSLTLGEIQTILASGGSGGYVNYNSIVKQNPLEGTDLLGDFAWPLEFKVGDDIPLGPVSQWQRRLAIHYPTAPTGTYISAFARIFSKFERMVGFDSNIESEVFNLALGRKVVEIEVPSVTGTHIAALASGSARDRIAQYDRSQQMLQTPRPKLYEEAQVHASALAVVFAHSAARQQAVISQNDTPVPEILQAVSYDYVLGKWVRTDTQNLHGPVAKIGT